VVRGSAMGMFAALTVISAVTDLTKVKKAKVAEKLEAAKARVDGEFKILLYCTGFHLCFFESTEAIAMKLNLDSLHKTVEKLRDIAWKMERRLVWPETVSDIEGMLFPKNYFDREVSARWTTLAKRDSEFPLKLSTACSECFRAWKDSSYAAAAIWAAQLKQLREKLSTKTGFLLDAAVEDTVREFKGMKTFDSRRIAIELLVKSLRELQILQ
jgi:hypothetical protein